MVIYGPKFLPCESAGISQNRFSVKQSFGEADLPFGDFAEVVLFGGEVEAGHGGAPVCVWVACPIATVSTHIGKKKARTKAGLNIDTEANSCLP